MKVLKRNYISRNKLPIAVIVIFYCALLYVLSYTFLEHDIRVHQDKTGQKVIIEVEKK